MRINLTRASAKGQSETPAVIAPNHSIADVVAWFPASEHVLERFGIARQVSLLGRMFGHEMTISRAALEGNIPLAELLRALNEARPAVEPGCRGCGGCDCGKQRAAAPDLNGQKTTAVRV